MKALRFSFICIFTLSFFLLHSIGASPASSDSKTIRAGVLRNWPPRYITDSQTGRPTGFAIDVMNKVAELSGLKIEYRVFGDWPDAIAAIAQKQVDILPNMGITPARKKLYDYTTPYETLKISVFVRETTTDLNDISQLSSFKTGAVETNQGLVLLRKLGLTNIQVFKSPEELFMGLLSGAVDAAAYPEQVIRALATDSGLEDNIKFIEPSLLEIKRGIAVRKGQPALLGKLEGAITRLLKMPEYKTIYERWHGKPARYWTLNKVLIAMALIMCLTFAAMFVWRYPTIIRLNRLLAKSEEKFRNLFENMSEGFSLHEIITDESGKPCDFRFIEMNPACEGLIGLRRADVVGKLVSKIASEPAWIERYGQVALTGVPQHFEEFSPFLGKWLEVFSFQSKPGFCASIFTDITDRKQMEVALKQSEEQFRHVFETANVAKSITLPNGEITVNSAFAEMLGYTGEELSQKTWQQITPQDEVETVEAIISPLLNGKKDSLMFNKKYVCKDGSLIWADVSTAIKRDNDGKPLYFTTTIVDITERVKTEEKLKISEAKFATAFQVGPAGLTITRIRDGKFLDVNESFAKMFGYERAEMLGSNSIELNMLDEQARQKLITAQIDSGGLKTTELKARDKSGQIVEILFSSKPMELEGENYHVTSMIDITERKEAERALRESEERFKRAFENIPAAVTIYDADLKIGNINKAITEITGRPISDFIGRREQDIWSPEIHGLYLPSLEKCLGTGQIQSLEAIIPFSKERIKHLNIIYLPLTNDQGAIREILAVIQDVTEQKKAEARRMELESVLRQSQKMESIGNLAGGIAHDFNNILSAIIGYTELSLDDVEPNSPMADNLKGIFQAGKRARDLVFQILTFARQSDEGLRPVRVDLVIQEALRFIRSSIPTTIDVSGEINTKALVMGNATQIHQIVMNLCTNAAHAMEDKGGSLEIQLNQVTLENDGRGKFLNLSSGDFIELRISDTGTGIPPEIIESIFDPYFTTRQQGQGTGLGLAVVHGIVESYGGKITAESKPGEGAVFSVFLPVTGQQENSSPYETQALPTGKERILLVDDEESVAEMEGRTLGRLGYKVTTLTHSLEALERFSAKPDDFDLVVTDMTMPNMTGINLALEILKIRPGIPVILCTGYSKNLSEEEVAKLGIKALLFKPIIKSELARTIRNVLGAVSK